MSALMSLRRRYQFLPDRTGPVNLQSSRAFRIAKVPGEILINGNENKSLAAKRDLGYIPEMPALYDMLTVWEHMEFIARAYSLQNWKERADMLLSRFELEDKKKKLGNELSKGMQQKVSICCGLLPEPKLYFLMSHWLVWIPMPSKN
jgi:ABC-type multidrug transport system ATPase subunit